MTATEIASPGIKDASNASPPPDWALVPFDVGCARCGHDLHGLSEPKCPACSLEFDWAEAVPIEELTCAHCRYHLYGLTSARCPECGRAFAWDDALADYHRRRLPYFEYRWQDQPVRSLFGTWWRALRPRRFWRNMNLHDPPAPAPLVGMVVVCVATSWCAVVAFAPIVATLLYMALFSTAGRPLRSSEATSYFVKTIVDVLVSQELWRGTLTYAIWLLSSLGSLLIFQQSMRRYRVRQVQVMRVWAYSMPMVLPLLVVVGSVYRVAAEWAAVRWSPWSNNEIIAAVSLGILVAFPIGSMQCGFHRYLRMRHAIAVAVSSQVIAILTTFAVIDIGLGYGISIEIIKAIGRWMGVW